MYSDLLQPNVIDTRIVSGPLHVGQKSVPVLDAVTTCSDDRKQLAIALVNRHPEAPARWKIDLGNRMDRDKTRVTVLSGDSPDAYNDVTHPARVVPQTIPWPSGVPHLELPPHSVAVLQCWA